jgi:hypothetical protein
MQYQYHHIRKINWNKVLPQLGFWIFITLLFLYERRYLIRKAGLPHFLECVGVRLVLLMALAYINLYVFIPLYLNRRKYVQFSLLLLLSLFIYIGLQSAYDTYLFGFVIGGSRDTAFWRNVPYNLVASAWYLLITVAFKISLDKIQQRYNPLEKNAADIVLDTTATPEYIYLKTGLKTVKTRIDDITYIQALKDYSIIYTSGEKIITKGTLKYIESILPANHFLRIHKSYIIAKSKILAVERTKVILSHQIIIPVGRNFQHVLNDF